MKKLFDPYTQFYSRFEREKKHRMTEKNSSMMPVHSAKSMSYIDRGRQRAQTRSDWDRSTQAGLNRSNFKLIKD